MGFILSFTDKFVAALSLWPFASFMLTLPILAYLYHRDGRLKVWSAAGAYFVVLYFLGLGCFTLYPLPSGTEGLGITYGIAPQLNPIAFVGDIYRDGITAVLQIVMNVVFFAPLGFIASRAFRMRFQTTLLLGFATSLLIETAQLTGFFWLYPYAYRTFDVCDLMWNTGGAVAGWWAARLLARVLPRAQCDEDSITTSPGFVRRSVAFMLDGVIVLVATLCVWSLIILITPNGLDVRFAEGSGMAWITLVIFVIVQFFIPLANHGKTPGGSFVRMTCETKERGPVMRVVFLAVRLVVIIGAFMYAPLAMPLLGLFFIIAHRMPYDYL